MEALMGPLITLLLFVLVIVSIFRWVFRINKIVSLLEKILAELKGSEQGNLDK